MNGGALNFTWLLLELCFQDEYLERCEVVALSLLVQPISMLYLASLLEFSEIIFSCTKDSSKTCLFFLFISFFFLFHRLDRQLQDIVYKLVVNLEESKSFCLLFYYLEIEKNRKQSNSRPFSTLDSLKQFCDVWL